MIAIPSRLGPYTIRVHQLPGTGPALVFIHGLGCASSCDYPAVARDASLAGRRAVLIDLLGSGFSDKPDDFGYSIRDHAAVVVDVANSLALIDLDLYGHSMGGSIAIEAARAMTERVRTLILSEPNLDIGGGPFSRSIAAYSEPDYLAWGHAEAVLAATRAIGAACG